MPDSEDLLHGMNDSNRSARLLGEHHRREIHGHRFLLAARIACSYKGLFHPDAVGRDAKAHGELSPHHIGTLLGRFQRDLVIGIPVTDARVRLQHAVLDRLSGEAWKSVASKSTMPL